MEPSTKAEMLDPSSDKYNPIGVMISRHMVELSDGQSFDLSNYEVKTITYGVETIRINFGDGHTISVLPYDKSLETTIRENVQIMIDNDVEMVMFSDGQAYNNEFCSTKLIVYNPATNEVLASLEGDHGESYITIRFEGKDPRATLKENLKIINASRDPTNPHY